jgi:predicted NUDIX family NTP pyrophosphohydrolase
VRAAGTETVPIESAGLLLYRKRRALQVFLIHMGGPFWAKKDAAAWSIPKGVIGVQEEPLAAAMREFQEETGFAVTGPVLALGRFRQNSSKNLSVWAMEGDVDPDHLTSTLFTMEWPPKSGRMQQFPEADRGGWFARAAALEKIVKGQRVVLEAFYAKMPSLRK